MLVKVSRINNRASSHYYYKMTENDLKIFLERHHHPRIVEEYFLAPYNGNN